MQNFRHLLKELTTINYLTDDQMKFIDIQMLLLNSNFQGELKKIQVT